MSKRNSTKRERSRSMSSDRDSYERPSKNKNERPPRSYGGRSGKSRKVYVSNINFESTFQDVKDEFNSVGEVTFVQMLKDDTNRFKGCAVITFKEPEMAQDAIHSMNRRDFKGRKLVVKEEDANPDLKGSDRKRGREDFVDRPPLSMDRPPLSMDRPPLSMDRPPLSMDRPPLSLAAQMMTPTHKTYGLSSNFLNSLAIDLPLVSTVFVANLDYTVSDDSLRDVFALAGNILELEIFKDKEGKSRGFGVVEYEHPVEAVQAVSMLHNQMYRDRLLTVRLDRSDRHKKDGKMRLPSGLKSVGMGLGIDGKPLKDIKSLPAANTTLPAINPMPPLGGQINPVALGSVNTSGLGGQLSQGMGGLMDSMAARMGNTNNPIQRAVGGGFPGGGVGGLAGGMGRELSVGSSYRGPTLGNIIQISNLPLEYNSDSLRKLCWTYGDVQLAEISSQGTGMVKFRSEADAQRASEMLDRQPFEGRILSARLL